MNDYPKNPIEWLNNRADQPMSPTFNSFRSKEIISLPIRSKRKLINQYNETFRAARSFETLQLDVPIRCHQISVMNNRIESLSSENLMLNGQPKYEDIKSFSKKRLEFETRL